MPDLSKLAAQAAKPDNKNLAKRVSIEQDEPESWALNAKPGAGGAADFKGVNKDNISRSIQERRPVPSVGSPSEPELGAGETMKDDIDRMDDHTQMLITALEELEQEGDWEVEPAKQPKYFIKGKPVY